MSAPLLLDTCAAIWTVEDRLRPETVELLSQRYRAGEPTYVSPITAWELGILFSRARYRSHRSPEEYWRHLLSLPNVRLSQMPPELMLASHFLPGTPPRDPADRILAATAREYDYTLVTRDALLLSYAREGHLLALEC